MTLLRVVDYPKMTVEQTSKPLGHGTAPGRRGNQASISIPWPCAVLGRQGCAGRMTAIAQLKARQGKAG